MIIYYQDILSRIINIHRKEPEGRKKKKLNRQLNLLTEWYTNELRQEQEKIKD